MTKRIEHKEKLGKIAKKSEERFKTHTKDEEVSIDIPERIELTEDDFSIQVINSVPKVIITLLRGNEGVQLVAQILQDAKIVDEIRNPDFVNHVVGKLLSATKGHVSPESVMYVIKQELQQLLGEKE